MNKFILIDQSIKDTGGHHLEYALRVLKAAKLMGFYTILATNKLCDEIKNQHIDLVEKAFTHTFWENYQSEFTNLGVKEKRFLKKIKAIFTHLQYLLLSSSIGFSYIGASEGLRLSDLCSRYGTATSGNRLSILAIVSGYILATANRGRKKITNSTHKFSPITRDFLRIWLFALIGFIGLLLSPVFIPYFVFRWIKLFGKSDAYAAIFSDDLQRMLIRVGVVDGDIVFIPTLGNVELFGAGICIESFPNNSLSWHFLFRRNIFDGREPSYPGQIGKRFKTINAFSAFKQLVTKNKTFFYTDTEALTEQYNRLGIFNFKTLPIPLDETLNRSCVVRDYLNIVYLGDARDEKGFPLLSRLIDDLVAAGYSKERVKFTIQSNFNVPGGEYGSRIAFAELSMESAEWISLVEGPFESNHYTEIINSADVILIPYDSECYYARSSGVFAEALAAGIPVVLTQKSWMAQELLHINQEYYCNLLHSEKILQSISFEDFERHSKLLIRPHAIGDYSWLLIEIEQLFKNPGQYIDVSWKCSPLHICKVDRLSNFFNKVTIDLRSSKSYALLCLPVKERLLLQFELDNGLGKVQSITNANKNTLSIVVHELELRTDTPLFQVGGMFCQEDDLSSAVIEVLEHHEQYLADASEYKKKWAAFHNAEILVKMLDKGTK